MGDILAELAGPSFAKLMAKIAPAMNPMDDDFSSAQEWRQRYLLAAMIRR